MENSVGPAPVQEPAKKKNLSIIIATIVLALVVAGVAIFFVVTGQKKEEAVAPASASTAPKVPSKEEVGSIMSSVDGKIEQANSDNTSANAALKDASTPVEVKL